MSIQASPRSTTVDEAVRPETNLQPQSPLLDSQPPSKPKQARQKRVHDDVMPSEPNGPCVLALTKVRRIAKLETNISMLGGDAAYLLAKSAELFIWRLAQDAFVKAKAESRKTLQYKDLASAVKDRPSYEFLLDVIPPCTTRDEYLNSIHAIDPPRIVPKHK